MVDKKRNILLYSIAILTFLVMVVGTTFAWFTLTISGNEEASSVFVSSAVLGNIDFIDGNVISLPELILSENGSNEEQSKYFVVANTNTDVALTYDIAYTVYLRVYENTLSDVANNYDSTGVNYFIHKLEYVESGGANNYIANWESGDVYASMGSDGDQSAQPVPSGTGTIPITTRSGVFKAGGAGQVHIYKYTITVINDLSKKQNLMQGKAFNARIQVDIDSD